MKTVYVAHPYNGEANNISKVQDIMLNLMKKYPDKLFISPIHATSFAYFTLPYLKGIEHCFKLLSICDEIWLYGDWQDSKGCCMEYGYAQAKGYIKIVDKKDDICG